MTFFDRSELEALLSPLSGSPSIEVLLRALENGTKRRETFIAADHKT